MICIFASMIKRITTYLLCTFAILLFLASSTGISFVIHHCSDNHTSEFHLFTSDYQCDHEKTENCGCCCGSEENSTDESNCSITKNHKCCSNTKGFIKVTDKYESSRYQFKFNTEATSDIFSFKPAGYSQSYVKIYYSFCSPPPLLSGQDMLIQFSQFII